MNEDFQRAYRISLIREKLFMTALIEATIQFLKLIFVVFLPEILS